MAKKVSKVIAYILLVLVLVGAIGAIVYFTNGLTSDFSTFYVRVGDTRYTDVGTVDLPLDEPVRFDVGYVFENADDGENRGYSVRIVPNVSDETDFDFTVDGQVYAFRGEDDFTEVFGIEQDETGFTVTNTGFTMQSLLQSLYADSTVVVPDDINVAETAYFNVVVSSYNDRANVVIGLRFVAGVTNVELDEDGIIL